MQVINVHLRLTIPITSLPASLLSPSLPSSPSLLCCFLSLSVSVSRSVSPPPFLLFVSLSLSFCAVFVNKLLSLSRERALVHSLTHSLFWVRVWVWDWIHTPPHTLLPTLLFFSPPSFPSRSPVRDGQTSPHMPRLVVLHDSALRGGCALFLTSVLTKSQQSLKNLSCIVFSSRPFNGFGSLHHFFHIISIVAIKSFFSSSRSFSASMYSGVGCILKHSSPSFILLTPPPPPLFSLASSPPPLPLSRPSPLAILPPFPLPFLPPFPPLFLLLCFLLSPFLSPLSLPSLARSPLFSLDVV